MEVKSPHPFDGLRTGPNLPPRWVERFALSTLH